ncbi:MAG: phage/plasmid primase, P4 family [Xanthobacteraceae bacterium]
MPDNDAGVPAEPSVPGWRRIIEIFDGAGPIEDPTQTDSYQAFVCKLANSRKVKGRRREAVRNADAAGDVTATAPSREAGAGGDVPEAAPGGGDGGRDGDLDIRCARRPLTDLGNAERFIERNGERFRYCPSAGWLAWDGTRWTRNAASGLVESAVHQTHRDIQGEADAVIKSGVDFEIAPATATKPPVMWSDALRKWGRASESAGKLACIARDDHVRPGLAAPYLAVPAEKLDANPLQINVLNGTLIVSHERDRERDCISFRPHDVADLITKICSVEYQPDATCPIYDRFLAEVQPDATVRRFLHQWGGLSLTGDIGEHKMCFWWGEGRNGKSTLLETWAFVAGDYAANTQIQTFLDAGKMQSGGQATPHLAKLPGVRMLRTSEPQKGARLDEALIKSTTGGDTIEARHLNREFFPFVPQFKLTMFGNHEPKITGADAGIWSRVVEVPWPVMIAPDRRDKTLAQKLRREGSGILNRLLDGLRDWIDRGLVMPKPIVEATEEYRARSDPLGRFLGECVENAPGQHVRSGEMYALFVAWAKANAASVWTQKGLAGALKDRRYESMHSNGMRWLDVRLVRSVRDFDVEEAGPTVPAHGGASYDEDDNDVVR